MIELKLRLILVGVAWVCFSDWVQCSEPDFHHLDECKRQCRNFGTPTESPTEVNSESEQSCVEKCLSLAEETASAPTHSTSEFLTTPSPTELSKFACPTDYGPRPGEIMPGEVSDFDVTFVQKKKENSQKWVVQVNWTEPKDANTSSNWRGYLAIWFSQNSESNTEKPNLCKCTLLHKNQIHFDINETDGWKYPENIYITIIALPTEKESFQMQEYDPRSKDWKSSGRYAPTITLKGHKTFRLTSAERIVLLIAAGVLLGFALMCMAHVWAGKRKGFARKGFAACKVALSVDKKAGQNKKADEMKDQLIA
ncbi:hypothetical protein ACROYT_G036901 [Oculina patagonica]